MITFDTATGAAAAGYVPARGRLDQYRNFEIRAIDTSGPNSFGYHAAIGVFAGPYEIEGHDFGALLHSPTFGNAESIWLRLDRNKVGQSGCFVLRFSPEAITSGLARARAWIDAYYESNPRAAQAEAKLEAELQAAAERQRAKRESRAARRARA